MSIRMAPGRARLTVLGRGWSDTAIESGDGFTVDEGIWDNVPPWDDDAFCFNVSPNYENMVAFRFLGNITVDWGDGNISETKGISDVMINGYYHICHYYAVSNIKYTISIVGDLKAISFLAIDSPPHGDTEYKTVTAVLTPFPATMRDVVNLEPIFCGSDLLTSIPADLFDNCPNVTSFASVFRGCHSLTTIPAGLFDNCPNVTSFGAAFDDCYNLTSIPAGLFDNCPNVTSFNSAFLKCGAITSALPELWNTHSDADGYFCFHECYKAANYKSVPEEWRGPW